MNYINYFATNLVQLREQREWTPDQLDAALDYKQRRTALWETERVSPKLSELQDVALLFQVDLDTLVRKDLTTDHQEKKHEESLAIDTAIPSKSVITQQFMKNLVWLRRHAFDGAKSQSQLARLLGVNLHTLQQWENGKTFPRFLDLLLIANTFGITLDTLVLQSLADGNSYEIELQEKMTNHFPENLRALRKHYGLSQPALGRKIKIPRSSIDNWESARTSPSITAILAMANLFHHLSITTLMTEKLTFEADEEPELAQPLAATKPYKRLIHNRFNRHIRQLCETFGWSTEQLATQLDQPIRDVKHWRIDTEEVELNQLLTIAEQLQVSLMTLVDDEWDGRQLNQIKKKITHPSLFVRSASNESTEHLPTVTYPSQAIDHPLANYFVANLKYLRESRGLLQKELAAQIHFHKDTITRWENGESLPPVDALVALANALFVDVNTLALLPNDHGQSLSKYATNPKGNLAYYLPTNLQVIRHCLGWNLTALGQRMDRKKAKSINQWESGKSAPPFQSVYQLADALYCDFNTLLTTDLRKKKLTTQTQMILKISD